MRTTYEEMLADTMEINMYFAMQLDNPDNGDSDPVDNDICPGNGDYTARDFRPVYGTAEDFRAGW